MGTQIDSEEASLSLCEVLVDECVLALLEVEVVDVARTDLPVDLVGVEDSLYLLVVVEEQQDRDLHHVYQGQELPSHHLVHRLGGLVALEGVEEGVLQLGRTAAAVDLPLAQQEEAFSGPHDDYQGLGHPQLHLPHFLKHP